MKNIFLCASLLALAVFAMTVSISDADRYFRFVKTYVDVYAYEGPNGEQGPYYCGRYYKDTKRILISHADGEGHIYNQTRFEEEWWSTCNGSSQQPDIPIDSGLLQEAEQDRLRESKRYADSLANFWDNLRTSYDWRD